MRAHWAERGQARHASATRWADLTRWHVPVGWPVGRRGEQSQQGWQGWRLARLAGLAPDGARTGQDRLRPGCLPQTGCGMAWAPAGLSPRAGSGRAERAELDPARARPGGAGTCRCQVRAGRSPIRATGLLPHEPGCQVARACLCPPPAMGQRAERRVGWRSAIASARRVVVEPAPHLRAVRWASLLARLGGDATLSGGQTPARRHQLGEASARPRGSAALPTHRSSGAVPAQQRTGRPTGETGPAAQHRSSSAAPSRRESAKWATRRQVSERPPGRQHSTG